MVIIVFIHLDLKRSDNIKNKNDFYNDLLTILINVST